MRNTPKWHYCQIIYMSGTLLLSITSPTIVRAQMQIKTVPTALPVTEPAQMSSQQFEQWVNAQTERLEVAEEKNEQQSTAALARAIEQALRQRLKNERQTTDISVLSVISHYATYEISKLTPNDPPIDPLATHSKQLITDVLPLLYGRSELQGRLLQKRSQLFAASKSVNEALEDLRNAAQLLSQTGADVDQHRIESQLEAANILLLHGQKKEADDLYLQVLIYPWYNLQDPQHMQRIRDLYVQAGMGLIQTRRGSLKGLKELYFAPATWRQLKAPLDAAISAAGGTP